MADFFENSYKLSPDNSHMAVQAYVTVEGVPVDIRIDGLAAQNRAVSNSRHLFRSLMVLDWSITLFLLMAELFSWIG